MKIIGITLKTAFLFLFIGSQNLWALEKPLWEVGVAAGGFSMPHYIGSDQRYTLPALFPYAIYRGKVLKADRGGIRGILLPGEKISFDMGFSLGVPVRKGENRARKGMEDLHFTGQVGPRLNIRLSKKGAALKKLFRFPLRGALNINGEYVGWVAEPGFLFSMPLKERKWSNYAIAGILYGSHSYNQTYYGVRPIDANSRRQVFHAHEGLIAYTASLASFYRFKREWGAGFFMKWHHIAHGPVHDSPLVKNPNSLLVAVALTRFLWESPRKVDTGGSLTHPDEEGW